MEWSGSCRGPVLAPTLEPGLDLFELVADVPPDPVADGTLTVVSPPIDGRERNRKVGGELARAEEMVGGRGARPVGGVRWLRHRVSSFGRRRRATRLRAT